MNVIIMAGGAGRRFWPVSRSRLPKQFLKLIGTNSLIEETYMRIEPLAEAERTYIIVHEDHRALTEKLFKKQKVRILSEPAMKNTAPCIGLGLIHILAEFGNEPVVVLPADHYIGDIDAFQKTVEEAVKLIRKSGIATIGIVPTRPETGYGYIRAGKRIQKNVNAYHVEEFVEKPSFDKAREFLSRGGYYWNGGIFVFMAKTMMEEIRSCLPDLHESLGDLRNSLGKKGYEKKLHEIYESIEPISIDYGVMEKTEKRVIVIPASFPWSDVGSWQAVYEMRYADRDSAGNIADGEAILIDCTDMFVRSEGKRLIGCIGLEGIFVIDADDALLICNKKRSQAVRRIIDVLIERKRDDLL